MRKFLWIFVLIFSSSQLAGQESQRAFRFIENKGQWPSQVHHKADLGVGSLYLEKNQFTYHFWDLREVLALHGAANFEAKIEANPPIIRGHVYRQKFVGANENPAIKQAKPRAEHFNYFLGDNAYNWKGDCRAFSDIYYQDLYNGIDLKVYSNDFFLKYDFIVDAGADATSITWSYEDIESVRLQDGRLIVAISIDEIIDQRPLAYQLIDGQKKLVLCNFTILNGQVGFEFPEGYDTAHELVIDPELVFSTYSGSTADNFGYTATYDADGFLYSGSSAFGDGYPVNGGSYQQTWAGGDGQGTLVGTDIAISKYDTTGTFMVYTTYLGGAADELPHSLIVDENDQLIVYGTTSSDNFPATNGAYDEEFSGGGPFAPSGVGVDYVNGSDIIVSKFTADGSDLVASTFLGGTGNDGVNTASALKFNYADDMRGEVMIDQQNKIYVVSCTFSQDFPAVDAFQPAIGGGLDGCIVKFDENLSAIEWSSFIGGSDDDAAYSLAVDSNNDIYLCGGTESNNFPAQPGAYQLTNQGGQADGWIAKIDQAGTGLLHCTHFGSPSYDQCYFVELDGNDVVHVFGQTRALAEFFIENANYGQANSGMLVAKLQPELDDLIWSTVFGTGSGKPNLSPTAFLVDICGRIYMSGWGGQTNVNSNNETDLVTGLETTADAYQNTTNGSDFYLLVIDADANDIVYGSFFGGGVSNEHVDGGTSRFDEQGVVYQSVCAGCGANSDFPIHPADAVSPTNNSSNCNNGVFKFRFELPPALAAFTTPNQGCVGEPITFDNQSVGATGYQWDFGDDNGSTDINPTHVYAAPGIYTVELIAENIHCGFSDTTYVQVVVSNLTPDMINATADPIYIAEGQSSQLNVIPPGYDYIWTPSGTLDNNTIQDPTATPPETTTYYVQVIDGDCIYEDSVRVIVDEIICGDPFIYVPNAFTPNGDDQNEQVFVRGDNITELYFVIYDRWGEKVFETNSQGIGWDGTYKDRPVDPAVFVYYLEVVCADEQEYFEKGNITVIR